MWRSTCGSRRGCGRPVIWRRRGWAAVRIGNGQGGRAVVEQSPVQLPRRMPVRKRGGGEGGQPGGDVVAGGRGAREGGGQRPPVRAVREARIDPLSDGLPRRVCRFVVPADRLALQL